MNIVVAHDPCGFWTATLSFVNDEGVLRHRTKYNRAGSPCFSRRQIDDLKPQWIAQGFNVIDEEKAS